MKKFALCTLLIALCACGGVNVVDLDNPGEVSDMQNVMALEYRDWLATSDMMVKSMLNSGAFARVERPIIAIAGVTNDTMQRFDTDILVKKIRSDLVNSGRAQIATNFSGEDTTSNQVRAERGNAEYAAGTIAAQGTLIAPNLSLSGKMIQRNFELRTCWLCSSKDRVEYYLQLALTEVKTGLTVWEDTKPIIKEGRNAPTW
ncbi:MAG: penicillin-binding protein activator LpoB [Alphaproteobacteria bacterium]|nr:penicillin-binding protein activator LpoB [Alphaproteobacteria bacterium]